MGDESVIAAPSRRHRTIEQNGRAVRRLAILVVTASALAFPGLARAAQLNVVPNGPEGVAVTVEAGGAANPPCTAAAVRTTECAYTYAPGTTVTLRATSNQFAGWSDVRCPSGPTCDLTLDEEATTIAASYAVQRVWVRIAGAGTVAAIGGRPCAVDPNDPTTADCGLFPLGSRVTLAGTPPANGPAPRWQRALTNPARPLCDDPPGVDATGDRTCPIDVNGLRWGNVAFDGEPFSSAVPSSVSVRFRILKVGNGSGTVRSGSLDCGGRCTVERTFGNRETLTADAGAGSRFVRWRGACATTPTCSLAVGPVTAVSAEFQPTGGSSSTPPRARALVARIARVSVRGRGRRRTVAVTVGVNARASIRVDLVRGRRVTATRRGSVGPGRSVLRLRVPPRARPGAYRVRLTAQGEGQTSKAARSVRLRR